MPQFGSDPSLEGGVKVKMSNALALSELATQRIADVNIPSSASLHEESEQ